MMINEKLGTNHKDFRGCIYQISVHCLSIWYHDITLFHRSGRYFIVCPTNPYILSTILEFKAYQLLFKALK